MAIVRGGEAPSAWPRSAVIALLGGAVAIAFAPILVRLSALDPTATAFHRLFLALPALWAWYAWEGHGQSPPRRPAERADWLALLVAGLFFAGDLALWHWSIRFTSVANATLLANFAPVFVTLAAFVLFGERFSPAFLAGMAVALAGACLLMGGSVSIGLTHLFGDALGLATAVFYAGYILSVGRLRARFSTATIMAWSGTVTAAALLPIALLSGESLVAATLEGWAVLLALALFSHAGGQSLIAHALAHLPAAFSSVSLLLQPAVAAILAWILLAEPLSLGQGFGGAVILVGIWLARRGSGPVAVAVRPRR